MQRSEFGHSTQTLGHSDGGHAPTESSDSLREAANGEETPSVVAQLQRVAKKSGAEVNRLVRENPTLALAGLVAVGALIGVALRQRRTQPVSLVNSLRADAIRNTRALRKAIRQEVDASGLSSSFDRFQSGLGAFDWKPFIEPLADRLSGAAGEVRSQLDRLAK